MSAHVLLNVFNELRKSDKMRGLSRILSLFCNAFNKFIQLYKSTNVRFYLSYDIKITLESHFWRKKVRFCLYVHNVIMDAISCWDRADLLALVCDV